MHKGLKTTMCRNEKADRKDDNKMKKIPIVMDCDPGSDDALAILMVHAAENIDLRAITTVAGNLNREITAQNALNIVEYFNIGVPVAKGSYPIMKKFEALDVSIMGEGGLGNAVLPKAKGEYSPYHSVELLHKEIQKAPGEIVILATGPLTNVALLLSVYLEDRELIKEIVIMGGAVYEGNHTPRTEFNIYTDAEAAKIVFQSGIPIKMIGTDVTYRTPVTKSDLECLLSNDKKVSKFIGDLMFYPGDDKRPFPEEGIFIWDGLAAAALICPECMEYKHVYVDVETRGELTYGETVADMNHYLKQVPNTHIAMECKKYMFLSLLQKTIEAIE